jgi:hypothetical protein
MNNPNLISFLRKVILLDNIPYALRQEALNLYDASLMGDGHVLHDSVGNEVHLTLGEFIRVADLSSAGKLIPAIKELRAITGEGLKEAKRMVERYFPTQTTL